MGIRKALNRIVDAATGQAADEEPPVVVRVRTIPTQFQSVLDRAWDANTVRAAEKIIRERREDLDDAGRMPEGEERDALTRACEASLSEATALLLAHQKALPSLERAEQEFLTIIEEYARADAAFVVGSTKRDVALKLRDDRDAAYSAEIAMRPVLSAVQHATRAPIKKLSDLVNKVRATAFSGTNAIVGQVLKQGAHEAYTVACELGQHATAAEAIWWPLAEARARLQFPNDAVHASRSAWPNKDPDVAELDRPFNARRTAFRASRMAVERRLREMT